MSVSMDLRSTSSDTTKKLMISAPTSSFASCSYFFLRKWSAAVSRAKPLTRPREVVQRTSLALVSRPMASISAARVATRCCRTASGWAMASVLYKSS